MNQRRIVFFSIFGAYHVILFAFTLYMDVQKQDFGLLTKMLYNISLFKYGALGGLLLFAIDFVWTWREKKQSEKELEAVKKEINVLKARVYDFQEADKKKAAEEIRTKTNE